MHKLAALTLCSSILALSACKEEPATCSPLNDLDLSNLQGYTSDGPYAQPLRACPSRFNNGSVCTIGELPPLAADAPGIPTIEQVLDRVAVSHTWMGDNFKTALEQMPADIRTLSKPLAAIVIHDGVRPSFFFSPTGTIYLDAKYLWLTPEQQADVTSKDDCRSAFVNRLSTSPAWRYVDQGDYAYSSNERACLSPEDLAQSTLSEEDNCRSVEDMTASIARLLFHELAHANDFIEFDRLPSLNDSDPFSALLNDAGGQMSAAVTASAPLQSQTLLEFAAVRYKGADPSSYIQSLTGFEAGAELSYEGANATYGYTNRHEDFAMLVEETMMAKHFGFQRDAGFVGPVQSPSEDKPITAVQWGQRGRLGAPLVKQRAQQSMEVLMPNTDWSVFFESLGAPSMLTSGKSWMDNLNPDTLQNDDINAVIKPSSKAQGFNDSAHPHE